MHAERAEPTDAPIRLVLMFERDKRTHRREQQAREVEASQEALKASISETERLVGESDEMLKRHRGECERDDAK
jgi:hypothetical protein